MYFPWPGFFEMLSFADIYVHLDDVQFSKGSFTNRVQIKQPHGITWMTVPLADRGSFQPIRELEPANSGFRLSHRDLLRQALKDAPHLDMALELFDAVMRRETINDVLIASIEISASRLGMRGPSQWLRSEQVHVAGRSSLRVLDIVKQLHGTRYVTAHGAADYLDHEAFEAAGVAVDYVDYSRTPYRQLHGTFTPFVSALDLIANTGAGAIEYLHPRTKPWREFLSQRALTKAHQ
jgi:hypothetical protein